MSIRKKICMVVLLPVILLSAIGSVVNAEKSVFIISKHSNPSEAQAYKIDNDTVTDRAVVDISSYTQGYGAVGIAVWNEKELMFVTYENSSLVVWASTKSLMKIGGFNTGVSNLAGIAVDEDNERIYIIRRDTDDLYVYSFDEVANLLVLEDHYELDTPSGALEGWGLALDESNDWLYVSTDTERVHVYDTSDWSHDHYIDISVGGNTRSAVGIAVDPSRGYLYTGDWQSHNYLVRTLTDSPYTSTEVEIGQKLIGVDVDEETGLVYCTTYYNDFRVYNLSLEVTDTETTDISGPAGVAVGGLYKKPSFYLTKDDDKTNPVLPEDEIEYTITYGPDGEDHDNVQIVDYLPPEVDFVSASDSGSYVSENHTVIWDIGTLDSGASNDSVTLTVMVNEGAAPGGVITNFCEIEGDTFYSSTSVDTDVGSWTPDSEIIYVNHLSPCVPGTGMSWQFAYRDIQDALARASSGNEIWVAEGTYYTHTDTDSAYWDVSFELVDEVGLYGGFAGNETSRSQRDWLTNETILEGDIPGGSSDSDTFWIITAENCGASTIVDGFTIKNGSLSVIKIDSSSPTIRNSIITSTYEEDGIECTNQSSPNIIECQILGNSRNGIYCNNGSNPNITRCQILDNDNMGVSCSSSDPVVSYCSIMGNSYGIYNGGSTSDGSSPVIKNNWICGNGSYGIYLRSAEMDIVVRNNTIADNGTYGIYMYGYSDIINCIVWGNGDGSLYWSDNEVSYSCVEGTPVYTGAGNINTDPDFWEAGADNYHITPDSPCKDAGDNSVVDWPFDIDVIDKVYENRIIGDHVDMGADEYDPLDDGENDLLSWWRFDEGEGDTAEDSIGGNDGTVYGASWTTEGQIDGALDFDGIDDYVDCGDNEDFDSPSTTNALTISAWVYPETVSGRQGIISKWLANERAYLLELYDDEVEFALGYNNGSSYKVLYASASLQTERWYHLAGIYDGSSMAIYVNGVPVNETEWSTAPSSTSANFHIGDLQYTSARRYFEGKIDDVRMYDRALTDEEIQRLYQEGWGGRAFDPDPKDEAVGVNPERVLNWEPGNEDVSPSHDVYFGTDYEDVEDADTDTTDIYKGRETDSYYDPTPEPDEELDTTTTYYWRIDEVYGASIIKGDVWNFTTWIGPEYDLAGWWKFDEGSGNTANDSSGNDNDGTVTGATWTSGLIDGALDFDGIDDYVDCGDNEDFDSPSTTNALTISAWVYPETVSGRQGIISKWLANERAYLLELYDDEVEFALGYNNGSSYKVLYASADLETGQWYHIAAVYDGSYMTIYVDGAFVDETAWSTAPSSTSANVHIGDLQYTTARRYFNGTIDDVRIYNRALSDEEVEALAGVE